MTDDGENQNRKGLEDYCVEQGLGYILFLMGGLETLIRKM